MPKSPKPPVVRVGLMRVRDHCTFAWRQPEGDGQRSVEVVTTHCAACLDDLQRRGYQLIHITRREPPNKT